MANLMSNKYSKTANDKYNVNESMWVIGDAEHTHLHHNSGITSSGPFGAGKYEGLPNFVGGLFVDNGMLKLKKKDDSTIILGKAGDHSTLEELMYNILDEIYSDEA